MTPKDVRHTIFTKLSSSLASIDSNWGTLANIAWPNKDFDPGNAVGNHWIRPRIKMGVTSEGEKGKRGIGVRYGVLMFNIFAPSDSGTLKSAGYASTLEYLFGARVISENKGRMIFKQANTDFIGNNGEGYYNTLVSIPFNCFTNE